MNWQVVTAVVDLVLGIGFLWGSGLLATFNPTLEIRNANPALHGGIQRAHGQFIATVHALGWLTLPLALYALTRGALELIAVWTN